MDGRRFAAHRERARGRRLSAFVLAGRHASPAGPDWLAGKMDPPGFPNTIHLWARARGEANGRFATSGTQLTEDLYVARAWPAPATSPATSSHGRSKQRRTTWTRAATARVARGAARDRLRNRVRARSGGRRRHGDDGLRLAASHGRNRERRSRIGSTRAGGSTSAQRQWELAAVRHGALCATGSGGFVILISAVRRRSASCGRLRAIKAGSSVRRGAPRR